MLKRWTRIADPALEERFRIASIPDDRRLGVAVILIWLVPIVGNTRIDWMAMGDSPGFRWIVAARALMALFGVASLLLVLRVKRPRTRDAIFVAWIACEMALSVLVTTQRTLPGAVNQGFLAIALVMAWVLTPVPFATQALLAAIMVSSLLVGLVLLPQSVPAHQQVAVFATVVTASLLGATVSLVIHRMRRAHFLAAIEAREAGEALLAAERQLAEAREKALQSQLIHIQRAGSLGSLATSLAHELGQPLTAIRANASAGLAYLGRETPEVGHVREALEDVVEEARRAGEIIRRMRGYLRRGEVVREPVSPAAIASDAVELVRPAARKRGVTVHLDLAGDLPEVTGDGVQFLQVAVIALTNAIEAIGPSAERRGVRLWARATADDVEMGVDDDGSGFDPAAVDRVFEPFFTTKNDGMGMGLPIARDIVEAHGGTIAVRQRPAGGARVSWRIPRGAAA